MHGSGTITVTHGYLLFDGVDAGQTVVFEDNASVVLLQATDFTTTPFNGSITGFAPGDTIDLSGITVTTVDPSTPGVRRLYNGTTLLWSLTESTVPGSFTYTVTNTGLSTNIGLQVACFVAGSRILTGQGEIDVQSLRAGMHVPTVTGRLRPVRWVGQRHLRCTVPATWPVRIRSNALGPGRPHRDLLLSADHAVFVAGALIPAGALVNGVTILREPAADVHYVHVELDRHDAVFAEGLACESYLDTGNRAAFANGQQRPVPPRFTPDAWEAAGFAPLVRSGPPLAAANQMIAAQAASGQMPDFPRGRAGCPA